MNEDLFTTNGAGRRQTWFEVDGVTDNDSWGRQTLFTNIPLAAVQEMSVLENAFSAEYGGSTGSVVNIITKAGGNQLHGDVMELWRPSATEAALVRIHDQPLLRAATMSRTTRWGNRRHRFPGAIDSKTHFFASGEYSREDRASPVISPVAPAAFVGHYRGWLGYLRLDHQINDATICFSAAIWTVFTTPIPTASWAATVCRRWIACSTGELIRRRSARRRC